MAENRNDVDIHAVSMSARAGDAAGNTDIILRWIEGISRRRRKKRHDIPGFILFPEMSISGYTLERQLLVTMKEEIDEQLRRIQAVSLTIPDTGIMVGYPLIEPGGEMFIRQSLINGGKITFCHDKTILPPAESKVFTPGKGASTCDVALGGRTFRIGFMICYETHFPEIALLYGNKECDIIFSPFASPREKPFEKYRRFLRYLPARAYDNGCFLAVCNLIQDFPKTGLSPGVGIIISPKGVVLKSRVSRRASVCSRVLDLDELNRIRTSTMGNFRKERK